MSGFRKKRVRIFDPSLMSGSEDVFRTNVGAGYITSTDIRGRYGTFYIQETDRTRRQELLKASGENIDTDGNQRHQAPVDPNSNPLIRNISNLVSDDIGDVNDFTFSSELAIPVLKYPARIYGDANMIENDDQWSAFINGTEYMDTQYKPMFADYEFYDHWFETTIPFTTMEVASLRNNFNSIPILDEINVSYEYNRFMKRYENWATTETTERTIPNLYVLQSFSEADDLLSDDAKLKRAYADSDINFVSREGAIGTSNWSALLKDEKETENEENISINQIKKGNRLRRRRMRKYLNSMSKNQLSESTSGKIDLKFRNILFDNLAMDGIFKTAEQNKNLFPYYAKISFEAHPSIFFSTYFNNNDFSSKLLVSLKESFGDNPTYVDPDEVEFLLQQEERIKRYEINSVSTIDVRLVDFGVLLNEARTNYINTKDATFLNSGSSANLIMASTNLFFKNFGCNNTFKQKKSKTFWN